QEVIKESEVDVQQRIAGDLEALVQEGLGLEETIGTGKGSQQGQEEEQSAKERMPKNMAGTALGAAVPVMLKAPASGVKRPASPVKKSSPTKLASKCRGCKVPKYEVSLKNLTGLTLWLTLSARHQPSQSLPTRN
ncbi:hypothetical protein C0993_000661, partial [Termitomyces sp. T159_Od127]